MNELNHINKEKAATRFQKKSVIALTIIASVISMPSWADRSWNYTYNSSNLLETSDGPRTDINDITTYGYDTSGILATITNPLSQVVQLQNYTGSGLPQTVIDANGTNTLLQYNWRNQVTQRTVKSTQGDSVTSFEYNPVGQLTKITLPDNTYLDYEYDDAHRLVATVNAAGERLEYALDLMGNRTQEQIKSSAGLILKTQSRVFDELGRLIKSIGAANQTTQYGYDKNSNLEVITDPRLNQTTRGFDALDRVISITDAKFGVTKYEYDAQNNLTKAIDPRNLATTYQYNGLGDRTQMNSPDTGATTYEYDDAGNVTKKNDARNVVTEYSFDALNRLLQVTYPAATAENISYSYDDTTNGNKGIGRLTLIADQSGSTRYHYEDRGNVIQETRIIESQSYVTKYSYDLADNLTQLTYPSGRIVSYSYNGTGQVNTVATQEDVVASAQTVLQNITYRPFGPVSSMTYGNGIIRTLNHDQDYQLAGVTSSILNRAYGYDTTGNIDQITDNIDSTKSQQFIYDELSRLTQSQSDYGSIEYQYDAVGNRTNRTQTLGIDVTAESFIYAADSNQLQQVYINHNDSVSQRLLSYTLNGNIKQDQNAAHNLELIYGDQNRLQEVKKDGLTLSMYVHNALGQRVVKVASVPTANQHFHYNQSGLLIAETDPLGSTQRETIYLNGIPVAVLTEPAPNRVPLITSTPITVAVNGQIYSYDVNGRDVDGDTLSYSLNTAPAGMTIDAVNGVINWTPTTVHIGSQSVTVSVSDGLLSSIQNYIVTVDPAPNSVPVITSIAVTVAVEGQAYSYAVVASDPDGDSLSYNLVSAPTGMTIDSSSGMLNWIPTNLQTGSQTVTLLVSDGQLNIEQRFSIEVETAPPPALIEVENDFATLETNTGWNYTEGVGFSPYGSSSWSNSGISTSSEFTDVNAGYSTRLIHNTDITNITRVEAKLSGHYDSPTGSLGKLRLYVEYTDGTVGLAFGYVDSHTYPSGATFYNNGSVIYQVAPNVETDTQVYFDVPSEKLGMVKDIWLNGSRYGSYPMSDISIKDIKIITEEERFTTFGVGFYADNLDESTEITGDWGNSTAIAGYYGSNFQYIVKGSGINAVTWRPSLPALASYKVYARWTAHENRATNAKYQVITTSGATIAEVDQRVNGSRWELLGVYELDPQLASVTLSDDADGYLNADAIRFELVGE